MDSRVQEFDDGETLDVLECGSCGYAEWSFEGDTWRFEVTGPHLPDFSESEGRERHGGAGAPHQARRD